MSVMTVTGPVNSESLGLVLPHEHAYIELRDLVTVRKETSHKVLSHEKVSLANFGQLLRNPYSVLDNAVIDEEEVAMAELREFKLAGGMTFVDVTLRDIGRDPVLLYRLAKALNINIVAGCGYYIHPSHPLDMDEKTIDHIVEEILGEIRFGIDGTEIKAGVIGEIGTSDPIHPNEKKVLIAAAITQNETGLGIQVHTDLWGTTGHEVIDILISHGAALEKICINHVDVDLKMDYMKALLQRGVYIEFDNFGKEFNSDKRHKSVLKGLFARDIERVRAIKELIDCGFIKQILVSNDVCLKMGLHRYGGWGYDHVLTNIRPMMEGIGLTEEQINTLMVDNPARFLDNGRND